MKKLWILLTLFLVGCSSASISTPTLVPATSTKVPTPTLIPIPTAYPSLQTDGPYLLFRIDEKNLLIMDTDGTGRELIELPENSSFLGFENTVSPDGKWIAYYTGSVYEEPYDLALNLFNISNGTTLFISSLIAPGYPENLEPVIEASNIAETDSECSDKACQLKVTSDTFGYGIDSLDWSPDSQFIAFSAQIDGPSSDVYLYSLEDKSIRRLSNEIENILSIDWSPSGEKILYLDSIPGRNFIASYIRIIDPKDKNIQNPKRIDGGTFWGSVGWIDDNLFFIVDGGGWHGGLPRNFRYINIDSQKITTFWEYETDGFAYIEDINSILINVYPTEEGVPLETGTYLISTLGEVTKLSDENYYPFSRQVFHNAFFFKSLGKIYLRSFDDTFSPPISTEINLTDTTNVLASPNKEWFIISENYVDNKLYSKDLQVIQSWDLETYQIIWRPDSKGFFIQGNGILYYSSINEKKLNPIYHCPAQDCSFRDYVWIP